MAGAMAAFALTDNMLKVVAGAKCWWIASVESIRPSSALVSPAPAAYLSCRTADQAFILCDNIRGASFMAGAMAAVVLNETMRKLVFAELELVQAIFLRGLLLSLLLALLGLPRGQLLHRPTRSDAGALALRVTGEIGSSVCFLTALYHMPLAKIGR